MKVRTTIVGESFHPGATERRMKLDKAERLLLMREPSNPFDKNAVAVVSDDGIKLGYVPRTEAPAVAKAMDSGLEPWAEVLRAGSTSIYVNWEG